MLGSLREIVSGGFLIEIYGLNVYIKFDGWDRCVYCLFCCIWHQLVVFLFLLSYEFVFWRMLCVVVFVKIYSRNVWFSFSRGRMVDGSNVPETLQSYRCVCSESCCFTLVKIVFVCF